MLLPAQAKMPFMIDSSKLISQAVAWRALSRNRPRFSVGSSQVCTVVLVHCQQRVVATHRHTNKALARALSHVRESDITAAFHLRPARLRGSNQPGKSASGLARWRALGATSGNFGELAALPRVRQARFGHDAAMWLWFEGRRRRGRRAAVGGRATSDLGAGPIGVGFGALASVPFGIVLVRVRVHRACQGPTASPNPTPIGPAPRPLVALPPIAARRRRRQRPSNQSHIAASCPNRAGRTHGRAASSPKFPEVAPRARHLAKPAPICRVDWTLEVELA